MAGSRLLSAALAVLVFLALDCAPRKNAFLALEVMEPGPGARKLLHYPTDGLKVPVNPPGFTWAPQENAARYSLVIFKGGSALGSPLLILDSLSSTVAVFGWPFEPRTYTWLLVYVDSLGRGYGRSQARTFEVAEGTAQLPMPDVARLREQLQGVRPRIFLTPPELARIKNAVAGDKKPDMWDLFITLADNALLEPLYPEPGPYKDGVWDVGEWRRIYTPAKQGTAHLIRLSLAWKLTGEQKYLDGAKRWLLHLASWDPRGITSHNVRQPDGQEGNDEASMPMLEKMAIAYDWIGGQLSEQEKALLFASMKERGDQVLALLKEQDFLTYPWSNHEGRVLAFLGLAGLSFLGEIPEAEKWMDYVLRCYLTSYPSFGGDDGGWAQGLGYWTAYVMWLTGFGDAMRLATDVDLYKRPFFRNTGYFSFYFQPQYAQMGCFGDHGGSGPSMSQMLLVQKFAVAFRDPVLLWYVDQIRKRREVSSMLQARPQRRSWYEGQVEDVVSVLNAVPPDLKPQPPTGLPQSKWLPNCGWVAMHSAFGDADRDVWALFKSSRYGSLSHSHADQNTFQLNAYGEALLIDSGYYPFYGSPHHALWTRQTKAHNGILVNGRGQPVFTMAASGTIEHFSQDGTVALVRGECAGAYNVPESNSVIDLWKEHLGGPPPSDPEVLTARRALAFVGSPEHPWMAVQDYLKTAAPTSFDYLLHSIEQMNLDQEGGKITVTRGKAGLDIYLLADVGLKFSQTDKFSVPPEERYQGSPNQWHFTAKTLENKDEVRFLAVFVPYRLGETPLAVTRIESGSARGFQVGDQKVLAWWGPGETGEFADYQPGRQGRLLVQVDEQGQTRKVLCE